MTKNDNPAIPLMQQFSYKGHFKTTRYQGLQSKTQQNLSHSQTHWHYTYPLSKPKYNNLPIGGKEWVKSGDI